MRNGYSSAGETVAAITKRAEERAFLITITQWSSATSLMDAAQDSAFEAQKAEDSGDLEKSLGLWVQASFLFYAADLRTDAQPGEEGAVCKEATEWTQVSALVALCFKQSGGRNPHSTSRAMHGRSSTRCIALNPSQRSSKVPEPHHPRSKHALEFAFGVVLTELLFTQLF